MGKELDREGASQTTSRRQRHSRCAGASARRPAVANDSGRLPVCRSDSESRRWIGTTPSFFGPCPSADGAVSFFRRQEDRRLEEERTRGCYHLSHGRAEVATTNA